MKIHENQWKSMQSMNINENHWESMKIDPGDPPNSQQSSKGLLEGYDYRATRCQTFCPETPPKHSQINENQ